MSDSRCIPRVLVVDDDPDILATVEHILRVEGYRVLSARNGQEALAVLDTVQPDLIILDLMMPVMDGWEFSQRLRNHAAAATPVLVVSADRDIHRKASAIAAQAYIAKPFDIDDLIRAVNRFAPMKQ
jgi:two-component system, chemotaxis family, chemotaxis protein CheY